MGYGMVPLALGGLGRMDYEHLAPSGSFLHVDDFNSSEHLARYLTMLDHDNSEYNRFFAWRAQRKEIMVRPSVQYCDLCKQLHLPEDVQKPRRRFGNLFSWFYDDVCMMNEANFGAKTTPRKCKR